MSILKSIIQSIADKLGLIDEWKQKGKNEVYAEISIIDRHLAGFCAEHKLPMPADEVVKYLKYYLMDTDSYLEMQGHCPDEVGQRGVKFIKSLLDKTE